jgi:hypothetical protein
LTVKRNVRYILITKRYEERGPKGRCAGNA